MANDIYTISLESQTLGPVYSTQQLRKPNEKDVVENQKINDDARHESVRFIMVELRGNS